MDPPGTADSGAGDGQVSPRVPFKNGHSGRLGADGEQIGSRLEADWKQIGSRLDADWKQTGSRLEVNGVQIGSKFETDEKLLPGSSMETIIFGHPQNFLDFKSSMGLWDEDLL